MRGTRNEGKTRVFGVHTFRKKNSLFTPLRGKPLFHERAHHLLRALCPAQEGQHLGVRLLSVADPARACACKHRQLIWAIWFIARISLLWRFFIIRYTPPAVRRIYVPVGPLLGCAPITRRLHTRCPRRALRRSTIFCRRGLALAELARMFQQSDVPSECRVVDTVETKLPCESLNAMQDLPGCDRGA